MDKAASVWGWRFFQNNGRRLGMSYRQISFDKKWDFRNFDSWKSIPLSELPKCFGKLRRQPATVKKAFKLLGDGTVYVYCNGVAYKSLDSFDIGRPTEKTPLVVLHRVFKRLFGQ
jgi:hypothetical protein